MSDLLDSDVLIALTNPEHPHHPFAKAWIDTYPRFAVCPITEGALVRFIVRKSPPFSKAYEKVLTLLHSYEGFEFWPADLSYLEAPLDRIQGHKQVTDAYLVGLARAHGGRLATFDQALAAVHPEAVLVPID